MSSKFDANNVVLQALSQSRLVVVRSLQPVQLQQSSIIVGAGSRIRSNHCLVYVLIITDVPHARLFVAVIRRHRFRSLLDQFAISATSIVEVCMRQPEHASIAIDDIKEFQRSVAVLCELEVIEESRCSHQASEFSFIVTSLGTSSSFVLMICCIHRPSFKDLSRKAICEASSIGFRCCSI